MNRKFDIDHIRANITEIESGAKGIEIPGDEIDRIIVFANKIRVYILPTGYFEFNITNEFDGDANQISTSVD